MNSKKVKPLTYARVAGIAYLVIIGCGMFAEFFVRARIVVAGDAAATAKNILQFESLFRAGFAADLLMVIADVAVAFIFYLLLRNVSQTLSLLAMILRLMQATVLSINLLNHMLALLVLSDNTIGGVFGTAQRDGLAALFLDAHGHGYLIAQVFFGLHCLLLGYLLFKSELFPGVLGVLIGIAGVAYLIESSVYFLLPEYEEIASTVVVAAASIGELALCLWLVVRGVRRKG